MAKMTWEEYTEARSNHVSITPELRSIIDGMLLSDASISRGHGHRSANIMLWQHPSRICWLEQMKSELENCGIKSVIDIAFQKPSKFKTGQIVPGGTYNVLRTMNYIEFVQEWERWHTNGKSKSVPKDIILNPTTIRHWFCGDGRGGDSKGTLGLCTDGFTHSDVEFLVYRLSKDLNIEALKINSYIGNPQILISRKDEAEKFKNIILPNIAECCKYKLTHVSPLRTHGRGRRLSSDIIKEVELNFHNGTCKKIAEKFGISPSKVWTIWKNQSQ